MKEARFGLAFGKWVGVEQTDYTDGLHSREHMCNGEGGEMKGILGKQ